MLFLTDSIFRDHYFYFVEPFCPGAWAVLSRAAAFRRIGRQLKLKFPYIGNFDSLHSQEPEINLFSPGTALARLLVTVTNLQTRKRGTSMKTEEHVLIEEPRWARLIFADTRFAWL